MTAAEFADGEYAEGYPWELLEAAEVSANYVSPCRHAIAPREEVDHSGVNGPHLCKYVTVPRLLRAHNEGHCNVTLLCADCVLEALKPRETHFTERSSERI